MGMTVGGRTMFENSEVSAWDQHWWGAKRLHRDNFLVLQNTRLFFPFSHKEQVEALEEGTVLHQTNPYSAMTL